MYFLVLMYRPGTGRKTINQINADARPKHYEACGMVGGDIAGLLLSRAIKEESLG